MTRRKPLMTRSAVTAMSVGAAVAIFGSVGAGAAGAQQYYYPVTPPPPACTAKFTSKLSIARVSTVGNALDVLAPITSLASGRVNVEYRGRPPHPLHRTHQLGCAIRILRFRGRIENGRWSINQALTQTQLLEIVLRTGSVHSYTLFTGYFARRIRGEMRAFQVLGNS